MSVRVRFAPSPTGHVHIGNIRAAIFNWLFARHEGGKFLLRIEDTDRERSTPEAVKTVMDALNWLGLDYDEEPLYQSSRQAVHLSAVDGLLANNTAYKEDKGGTGKGECVVFRMPGSDSAFDDEIKGRLEKKAKDMKDFVIVRSDGTPTFHLANVMDDIEMGVTHIIRGDDHVENTHRHKALFEALGATAPKYGHLPMIVNQQGKPYSKRDGAAFVGEFREKGYLPETLFNYLSLLGWSPGDDREKLSKDELVSLFTLDRVKSGPAQMDLKKLTHMNSLYVADLPSDTFLDAAKAFTAGYGWADGVEDDYFRQVCELMQSRTHVYSYMTDWKYFFSDELEFDEKAVRKILKKEGVGESLALLNEKLQEIDFTEEDVEKVIRLTESERDIKEGKLNQPTRVAISGISKGAGLYETMMLLGKDRCISRINNVVSNMCV